MKKSFVVLLFIGFVVSFASLAMADFDGTYSIDSTTITPPTDGVVWDGSHPAQLEVGTTYSVAMDILYDASASDDDPVYNALIGTITFDDSGNSFASQIDHMNSDNMFNLGFSVEVTEDMLGDESAIVSFQGSDSEICWHDLSATYELPVDVSAPVPEPSTLLLLGAGIVGLVGYSRRRKE